MQSKSIFLILLVLKIVHCVMNNPELYIQGSVLQRQETINFFEDFVSQLPQIIWQANETIIDIGSGDGYNTVTVLRNCVHPDFSKIVGIDISKEMVDYANENYRDDKTSFIVLDIVGDIPDELKSSFNHASSTFTLQWIRDQKKAFENIYDLLKPDGDTFFMFPLRNPLYTVLCNLVSTEKWASWSDDVQNLLPSYYYSEDQGLEIKNTMENVGFENIVAQIVTKSFSFSKIVLRDFLKGLNFLNLRDEEIMNDFLDDFEEEIRFILETCDESDITLVYELFQCYATKNTSLCYL